MVLPPSQGELTPLYPDQASPGDEVLTRLHIRVRPAPAPAPAPAGPGLSCLHQAARAPHLLASLPGLQESLDSEIGSRNTFAPIITLPSPSTNFCLIYS